MIITVKVIFACLVKFYLVKFVSIDECAKLNGSKQTIYKSNCYFFKVFSVLKKVGILNVFVVDQFVLKFLRRQIRKKLNVSKINCLSNSQNLMAAKITGFTGVCVSRS